MKCYKQTTIFSVHSQIHLLFVNEPLHFLCKSSNEPGPVSSGGPGGAPAWGDAPGVSPAGDCPVDVDGGGGTNGGAGAPAGPAAATFPICS